MIPTNLHSYAPFKDAQNCKNNKGVHRVPQAEILLNKAFRDRFRSNASFSDLASFADYLSLIHRRTDCGRTP
jgi:hypothetical protein